MQESHRSVEVQIVSSVDPATARLARGRAPPQPSLAFIMTDASFSFALTIAATWTFLVSLTAGMLLVRSQTARGPPHPFS